MRSREPPFSNSPPEALAGRLVWFGLVIYMGDTGGFVFEERGVGKVV